MKTIFFIRHAKSSWENPDLRDIDRPLNKRGLRDAPFMSKLLRAKEGEVDKIISSSANRAFTTSTYFAKEFGFKIDDIIVKKEINHAFIEDVFALIHKLDDDWDKVCIFGHNPTFTSIANHFSEKYIANVPTCGIIKIESTANTWQSLNDKNSVQKAFYFPKQYF